MKKEIRVLELFAGVGGFRLGLEGWEGKSSSSDYEKELNTRYKVVWSNQWEPKTISQHASNVYVKNWGTQNHSNEDITQIDINKIPDHDLLVGGFPCQDYSVATSLVNSRGLEGKKGVLWWSIHKIISERKNTTKYLFLENVDRLLISPSKQKGRDFAIILESLNQLGYAVEWRVINAADYGMPQRRKRIYILAYHNTTELYNKVLNYTPIDWISKHGVFAKSFPVNYENSIFHKEINLGIDLLTITEKFNSKNLSNVFENSGLLLNGKVTTVKTSPIKIDKSKRKKLGQIITKSQVDERFYIPDSDLERWKYLKGSKKEKRIKDGFEYYYSEGSMTFPDDLENESRTIITGEGGTSPSRFKHVIDTPFGYRRLTPIELEKLNMFPPNHTLLNGVTDTKRAFFMGNALVVGIVEKIGLTLQKFIK